MADSVGNPASATTTDVGATVTLQHLDGGIVGLRPQGQPGPFEGSPGQRNRDLVADRLRPRVRADHFWSVRPARQMAQLYPKTCTNWPTNPPAPPARSDPNLCIDVYGWKRIYP